MIVVAGVVALFKTRQPCRGYLEEGVKGDVGGGQRSH